MSEEERARSDGASFASTLAYGAVFIFLLVEVENGMHH